MRAQSSEPGLFYLASMLVALVAVFVMAKLVLSSSRR